MINVKGVKGIFLILLISCTLLNAVTGEIGTPISQIVEIRIKLRDAVDSWSFKPVVITFTKDEVYKWIRRNKFKEFRDVMRKYYTENYQEEDVTSVVKTTNKVIAQMWNDSIEILLNCDAFAKAHDGKAKKAFEEAIKDQEFSLEFKYLKNQNAAGRTIPDAH